MTVLVETSVISSRTNIVLTQMDALLQEARELGYATPRRQFQNVEEIREYYRQATFEDMSLHGLILLARANGISISTKKTMIKKLLDARIRPPSLPNPDESNIVQVVANKLIPFPVIDFVIPIKEGDLRPDSLRVILARHFNLPKDKDVRTYLNSNFAPGTILRLRPYGNCVNRSIFPLYDYTEKGITYCFDEIDERLINHYEVNPYTGRSLSLTNITRCFH